MITKSEAVNIVRLTINWIIGLFNYEIYLFQMYITHENKNKAYEASQ